MELVRLIRDNNIICDKLDDGVLNDSWEWNRDPDGGKIQNPTSRVDAVTLVALKNAPGACGALRSPRLLTSSSDPLLLDLDPLSGRFGFYNYSSETETIYVRRIQIDVGPSGNDPDIPKEDQMDVIATVEWQERGITGNSACPILGSRCLTVRERLYNWK